MRDDIRCLRSPVEKNLILVCNCNGIETTRNNFNSAPNQKNAINFWTTRSFWRSGDQCSHTENFASNKYLSYLVSMQLRNHADTQPSKRYEGLCDIHDINVGMLQVRENEISLRKWSLVVLRMRNLEGRFVARLTDNSNSFTFGLNASKLLNTDTVRPVGGK